MIDRNDGVIRELVEQAKAREGEFLDGLARRLNRGRITEAPQHPFRGAPDFWRGYELSGEQRVELFMKNWASLGGVVQRFADEDGLSDYIADVALSLQAKYLIRFDHPLLEGLELENQLPEVEMTVWQEDATEDLKAKAAGADIGIAVVDYAIAHTGTVVVASGGNRGRSVSLLPTAFMAVIRAESIRTRMGEVMEELQKRFGHNLPAGVHFISGPSRSADIENDLTIGVHGPGIVYALILDN